MKIRKELSGNNLSAYRPPVSLRNFPDLSDEERVATYDLADKYPTHIHRKRAKLHYLASDFYRDHGERGVANDYERMGLMHENAAGIRAMREDPDYKSKYFPRQ
jgi:hypothetical protein